ncbi:hypothetical protein, partial [Enterococcus faecalis]
MTFEHWYTQYGEANSGIVRMVRRDMESAYQAGRNDARVEAETCSDEQWIAEHGTRLARLLNIDGYDLADRDAQIADLLKRSALIPMHGRIDAKATVLGIMRYVTRNWNMEFEHYMGTPMYALLSVREFDELKKILDEQHNIILGAQLNDGISLRDFIATFQARLDGNSASIIRTVKLAGDEAERVKDGAVKDHSMSCDLSKAGIDPRSVYDVVVNAIRQYQPDAVVLETTDLIADLGFNDALHMSVLMDIEDAYDISFES